MNRFYYLIVIAVAIMASFAIYPWLFRGQEVVAESQLQEVVYVDTESGKPYLLRAKVSPATNPETGKQTLVPGLYCEKCAAWKAVGSMERLQTGGAMRKCPRHKIPLKADGPLPEPAGK